MVEHWSTASNTLLQSEHIVTDNESPSSEGASEGDTDKHDGYDADEEIPMSDREGVIPSKLSTYSTHTHAYKQVQEHLHPNADNAQRLTVESLQANLLMWHYCLRHCLNKLERQMAEAVVPHQ